VQHVDIDVVGLQPVQASIEVAFELLRSQPVAPVREARMSPLRHDDDIFATSRTVQPAADHALTGTVTVYGVRIEDSATSRKVPVKQPPSFKAPVLVEAAGTEHNPRQEHANARELAIVQESGPSRNPGTSMRVTAPAFLARHSHAGSTGTKLLGNVSGRRPGSSEAGR
jgi:hypothetical protein